MKGIVLLGKRLNADGTFREVERFETALEVLSATLEDTEEVRLIISGGSTNGHVVSEAASLHQRIVDSYAQFLPYTLIEEKSKDTLGNAAYTKAICKEYGVDDIVLITSLYHMPRAHFVFDHVYGENFSITQHGSFCAFPIDNFEIVEMEKLVQTQEFFREYGVARGDHGPVLDYLVDHGLLIEDKL